MKKTLFVFAILILLLTIMPSSYAQLDTFWKRESIGNYQWYYEIKIGDGRNDGVDRIYCSTPYGHVVEWSYNGEGWTMIDCGVAPESNDFRMVSIWIGDGRNDGFNRIYGANADGNIYEFSYVNEQWEMDNLGNPTDAFYAVTVGNARNDGINRVIGGAGNAPMYEYSYSGFAWLRNPVYLTDQYIWPMMIGDGRNDGINRIYGPDWQYTYLREYTWNGQSYDMFSIPSPTPLVKAIVGDGRNDGLNRVYASGTYGHIQEFTYIDDQFERLDIHPDAPELSRYGLCIGNANHDGENHLYSVSQSNQGVESDIRQHTWDGENWNDVVIDAISGASVDLTVGKARNDEIDRVYVASTTGNIYEYTHTPILIEFEGAITTGHAPLSVQFSDSSISMYDIIGREWDFNNDDVVDSQEQNPLWTYEEPGLYSVNLEILTDELSANEIKENYIKVFDGQSSLFFDGTESYVFCPPSNSINLTNEITLETWINPNSWGEMQSIGFGRIIDKQAFSLYLIDSSPAFNDSSLVFQIITEGGASHQINTPINSIQLNQWQHVAATYDGTGEAKIYINGEEQITTVNTPPIGSIRDNLDEPLLFGSNSNHNWTFEGNIDDIRLWNFVRTSQEINANKDYDLSGSESGLMGYWSFNEGSGENSTDAANDNIGLNFNTQWDFGKGLSSTSIKYKNLSSSPTQYSLKQNYPNPFNPTTSIQFEIPQDGDHLQGGLHLTLNIYDVSGKLIKNLVDEQVEPGYHSVVWNGKDDVGQDVPSGLYFYQFESQSFNQTKQMLLVK